MARKPRSLCICLSGNVRSVTLGRLLKKRGHEVLCCGVDKAFQSDTVQMLVAWADHVWLQADAEAKLRSHLGVDDSLPMGEKFSTRYDVGPDDWKVPDHPDLLGRLRDLLTETPPPQSAEGGD